MGRKAGESVTNRKGLQVFVSLSLEPISPHLHPCLTHCVSLSRLSTEAAPQEAFLTSPLRMPCLHWVWDASYTVIIPVEELLDSMLMPRTELKS